MTGDRGQETVDGRSLLINPQLDMAEVINSQNARDAAQAHQKESYGKETVERREKKHDQMAARKAC
jgi:hypothetical protein